MANKILQLAGGDGTAIPAAYVGEVVSSTQTTYQNAAGSSTHSDITSISLKKGIWDITAIVQFNINGATMTGGSRGGIGSASGSSSTGFSVGDTAAETAPPTGTIDPCVSIPPVRVYVTVDDTPYYLKQQQYYSAGTPRARGRITAIRIA